jgi:integrating conjugative element membrane protein (TIGR03747 family)
MVSANQASAPTHPARQGFVPGVVRALGKLLLWLLVALIFSMVLEWVGMVFWWPEEGAEHSRNMLLAEIGYLNADFRESLISHQPAAFGRRIADVFYHYGFELTGIAAIIQVLSAPDQSQDGWLLRQSRALYQPLTDYIIATVTITQVFALRLAVLALASPLFALAAIVGLADGLVERDRRRFGGAREKGLVYHHAKRFVLPTLIGAWVVYLSLPISVHPNVVIQPFAVLFALALGMSAGTFKKTL